MLATQCLTRRPRRLRRAAPRRSAPACRRCWSPPSASPRRWRRACTAGGVSARATVSGSSAPSWPATRSRASTGASRRSPAARRRMAGSCARPNGRRRRPSCLWRDGSPSMRWHSRLVPVEKRERAGLLLLALAALLLRGGERVTLIAPGCTPRRRPRRPRPAGRRAGRPGRGRIGLPPRRQTAAPRQRGADRRLPRPAGGDPGGNRPAQRRPGHRHTCCRCSIRPRSSCPYSGRIRFRGVEHDGDTLIPRVESVRTAYAARLKAQQDGLAAICGAAGFSFAIHRTDHPPEAALLGLYTALSAR